AGARSCGVRSWPRGGHGVIMPVLWPTWQPAAEGLVAPPWAEPLACGGVQLRGGDSMLSRRAAPGLIGALALLLAACTAGGSPPAASRPAAPPTAASTAAPADAPAAPAPAPAA